MRKTIFLIFSVLLLVSCEKEIEYNGEQTDPRLVINSLVEAGQPVSARISKSIFFLDDDSNMQCPDDAVATLYVNGNLYGIMNPVFDSVEMHIYYENPIAYKIEKRFQSDYCPAVGDIIKITASAQGFEDVEGITSALPSPVECQLVDKVVKELDSYYIPTEEGDSVPCLYGQMELSIEVTDPNPGQTDLYRIIIPIEAYDTSSESQYYASHYYVAHEYTDPIFGASIETNDIFDFSDLDTRPEEVFSDALFDGGAYRIKVPIYFDLVKYNNTDADFFRVPIKIEHLSKEYYYYLNTCNQGDATTGFFTEPIQVYSNVTNGYGLVGGLSTSKCWLPLPLEVK